MYAIEERLVKLNTQLEQARNDLKSKLTKKNINFNSNDSLRKLISLIPRRISKPSQISPERYNHTAVNINNNVLFSGGYTNVIGAISKQELYNILTDVFTSKRSLNQIKNHHSAVGINDNILVSGGTRNGSTTFNDNELYNILNDTFTTKTNLPKALYGHTSVNLQNNVLITGGGDSSSDNLTQYLYNFSYNTFTSKSSTPHLFYDYTAVNINNNVLFSGANTYDSSKTYVQYLYNWNNNTYTSKRELNPPRNAHTAVNINNNVLFSGGSNISNNSYQYLLVQELYNLTSNTFTGKINLKRKTTCHTAVNINNNVLLSGGLHPEISYEQELYIYDENRFA